MSTQARSPELSCILETEQSQQAAWVEELVVGVEDRLNLFVVLRHVQQPGSYCNR